MQATHKLKMVRQSLIILSFLLGPSFLYASCDLESLLDQASNGIGPYAAFRDEQAKIVLGDPEKLTHLVKKLYAFTASERSGNAIDKKAEQILTQIDEITEPRFFIQEWTTEFDRRRTNEVQLAFRFLLNRYMHFIKTGEKQGLIEASELWRFLNSFEFQLAQRFRTHAIPLWDLQNKCMLFSRSGKLGKTLRSFIETPNPERVIDGIYVAIVWQALFVSNMGQPIDYESVLRR